MLADETLPSCRELRLFNSRQTEKSEEVHFRRVKWLAWGLAIVGGVGAFAGIFLGYGVARGLRRSIYQVSVRIRDAGDRLGQELPAVTLAATDDFTKLHGQLENLAKDTQTLLQQQARTITELQNGLMRTRMVPFQRHVQRLARIVRQAAADTGKRAELIIEGASGELDRQVLERMLPPFEHMLRNAVVHGIEKPEERVKRGKPDTGHILLELHREGAEVMVRLTDDGGGMNLKAIRDKGPFHPPG